TAARARVMTGAEGERRLDLHRDPVSADPFAVVPASPDKAPRHDGPEPFETLAYPVRWRERLEDEFRSERLSAERGDQRPDGAFIRFDAEAHRPQPVPSNLR